MTEKKPESMLRLTVILLLVSALMALVLSLTNYVTKDKIAQRKYERVANSLKLVLEAEAYAPVAYEGGDSRITGAYKAGDKGYVVLVSVSGSQGMIDMAVGVDPQGAVTGASITGMVETAGLGTKAAGADWLAQFKGQSGALAVNKDGGTIDAITGATVTSRAVTNGVNAAVDAAKTLG